MLDWLVKLAGARTLDPDAVGVRVQFAHELSPTVWVIIILAAFGLALLSYGRLAAPTWARLTGAMLRAAAIVLIVFLLTGPKLVQVSERVEKDWVLVLADRSGSMALTDAASQPTSPSQPASASQPRTRDAQLQAALDASRPAWAELGTQRVISWLGFDAGVYDLPILQGTAIADLASAPPVGRATDVLGAIDAALDRASTRPVSGIVLLTDGRSTTTARTSTEGTSALLRRLSSERIGVYVLPLGSPTSVGDLAIAGVDAPRAAFAGDRVPVNIKVRRSGLADPAAVASATDATIQLIDEATGRVMDEQRASLRREDGQPDDEAQGRVTLSGTPEAANSSPASAPAASATSPTTRRWRVRVLPLDGESELRNNEQTLAIDLVDRPLRLLYLDGYPRWEYRFLKNVLARERSLTFVATLLSPGRRFISEGAEEVFAMPTTDAEWDRFDVFMLGDLQANVFTPEQLAQVRRRVATGGAGLVWIAGEAGVPQAFVGTPLADLLPIVARSEAPEVWNQDVVMRPTPLAQQLGVLRLAAPGVADGWPAELSDPSSGWSRLRWAQRLTADRLKPAAEVLATAEPTEGATGAQASPLVVTMRYGAGRIVYIATDEVWRYRYGRGEEYVERFYLQLIRLLGRESVSRSGRAAVLEVIPPRVQIGQAARVRVELVDQSLTEAGGTGPGTSMRVRIAPEPAADGNSGGGGGGGGGGAEVTLRSEGPGSRVFVGAWVPSTPGRFEAQAIATILDGQDVRARVEAFDASDELRRPEADHTFLEMVARQSGGAVLKEADLARLGSILPRREVRVVSPSKEETLWDRSIWLLLLAGLVGAEWVLRRLTRLT